MNEKGQQQTETNEKEGKNMAVLAKPVNNMTVIKKNDSRQFVREFNEHKVTEEFLDTCKKAGELFAKKK